MRTYRIDKAEWSNKAKSVLILNVTELLDGLPVKQFQYGCNATDPAELNQILWEQAKEIKKIPIHVIPEKTQEEKEAEFHRNVEMRLNEFFTPIVMAKAELDPEFSRRRKEVLSQLVEADKNLEFDRLGSISRLGDII